MVSVAVVSVVVLLFLVYVGGARSVPSAQVWYCSKIHQNYTQVCDREYWRCLILVVEWVSVFVLGRQY